MKKTLILFLLVTLCFTLTTCYDGAVESAGIGLVSQQAAASEEVVGASGNTQQNSAITPPPISVEYDQDDLDPSVSSSHMSYIKLEGDSIIFEGEGATVEGNIVTITSAGTYSVSGALNDGQIIVDTEDEGTVRLVLNGADITCSTSAPIYVSNAEKAVITLADRTENFVTDGASYFFEDVESDEPNAAVFSKDDLTINGSGSLTINANYNNGITSKDDLKITGGSITVNAVNDGIKGKDSIAVMDGIITVNAGGDGMQSNNDEDVEKGYISIEGGTLDITAGLDGIQAETSLLVSGGEIAITAGTGSGEVSVNLGQWGGRGMGGNPNQTTESTKGLKAGVDITITGGVFNIDSLDDAIHSNDSITISGGDFQLASGDDGIHSDSALTINGGNLNIAQSYEGLESVIITINDGTIRLVASDDGINASSGNGGGGGGMPGRQPGMFESGDNYLYINGGYIAVDATGDGFDINGPIDMTGGVVIVNGPTGNNNGALDYGGAFTVTGGFLVAAGSAGMAQAPSASSTQYSVVHTFSSPQSAGTLVHIETEDGVEILTFEPTKEYQSVVLSSPELENGATYTVYAGGSSTGAVTDGLYSGGTYTAGTQVASFTISSIVTGESFGPGGFGGRGGGRP